MRQCGHWRTLARSTAGSRVGHYNYFRSYSAERGRYTQADPIGLDGGFNRFGYAEGDALSYSDPTGEIVWAPIVAGVTAGLIFNYLLEQYKEEYCTCEKTPLRAGGNAALGGAVGGSGPFAKKPRGGVDGGGPSRNRTSSFSTMNHNAQKMGKYSIATRNKITWGLRKIPYVGGALISYELFDALSCD